MGKYLLRRTLGAIPVFFLLTVVTFVLIQMAPGDPIVAMESAAPSLSAEDMGRIREALGLDAPVHVQYLRWLARVSRGQLGRSYVAHEDVSMLLSRKVAATFVLTATALVISLLIGVICGVTSALRQHSVTDYAMTLLAFAGISIPPFWLGIVLMLVFTVWLRWTPVGGMASYGAPFSLVDRLRHLLLPATTLALPWVAQWTRFVRSSMIEVLRQDYIRTARAKGVHEGPLLYKHALRNAIIPLITMVGLNVPYLFSGSVIAEQLFSWPGIGQYFLQSVTTRDYPVLMGTLLVISIATIVGNVAADIVYALVDPRIRYS